MTALEMIQSLEHKIRQQEMELRDLRQLAGPLENRILSHVKTHRGRFLYLGDTFLKASEYCESFTVPEVAKLLGFEWREITDLEDVQFLNPPQTLKKLLQERDQFKQEDRRRKIENLKAQIAKLEMAEREFLGRK
jgi:hypothetical protein